MSRSSRRKAHHPTPSAIADAAAYRTFLEEIGYLVAPPETVQATTQNVDSEIATQAGPQLVVPMSMPRVTVAVMRGVLSRARSVV